MSRRRLIVDGNNVIGSRPDGWWRDRPGAARRLVGALQRLAATSGDRIAVVLDGRPLADVPEGVHRGVLVAYATRGGRDAADDRIVDEVARDREPASLVVVTSDRALAERVEALGRASSARARCSTASTTWPNQPDQSRAGIETPVTPSSRCTRNVFNAIDTRWYCPTVNTTSRSCWAS
jgi:predicted RNA-binding protein with PIN domain